MPIPYHSPFTDEIWPDVRPALGTLIALAHTIDAQRPRRKPGVNLQTAITRALGAGTAYATLAVLNRFDEDVGRQITDIYWDAKAAKHQLLAFLDDEFLRCALFWQAWRTWQRDRHDPDSRWAPRPVGQATHLARVAWWVAHLTEQASAGNIETLDVFGPVHSALTGALEEVRDAGVAEPTLAANRAERLWRFVCAAGRLPRAQDADLLAAYEAAVLADAPDAAVALVRAHIHSHQSRI